MKKKLTKLLLLAVGLIVGSGTSWSQENLTGTYLTNPNFEGEFSISSKPNDDRAIYQPSGWTVTYADGDSNDMTALNSSCLAWNNFSGRTQPTNGGNNTYWIRFRWGDKEKLTLSQSVTLPAGSYVLCADAFFNGAEGGSATIFAGDATKNISGNSTWSNNQVYFVSDGTTAITIGFKLTQTKQAENVAAFDNFQILKPCYLYNVETGLFLSRGAAYGTAVWADNFGIPVKLIPNGEGYRLQWVDRQDQYVGSAWWSWADKGVGDDGDNSQTYTLSPVENGYKLVNTHHGASNLTLYINTGANNEGFTHQIASNGSYEIGDANIGNTWQFKTQAEHDAIIAQKKAAVELAIATQRGYQLAENQTLKALVEDADRFAVTNKTSSVTNAALTHNYDGWSYAKSGGGDPGGQNGNGVEVYQGSGIFSQTVSDLPNGIYKVTVSGFYRDGSNANCSTLSNAGWKLSNAYLEANGNQTMIADWASDRSSDSEPNSPGAAKTLFDEGKYLNEVYALVTDGTLTISIAQPGAAVDSRWFLISNVTLTYYNDQVLDEDAAEIIQTATDLKEKAMQGTLKQELSDALDAFNANKNIPYFNALNQAIDAATPSAEAYEAMANQIALATGLSNNTNLTNGKDDLSTALGTAETAYAAATTDMSAETTTLKDAINTFLNLNKTVVTGKYYIQHVESGLYMASGHNWGTRGIVNEAGLDLKLEEQTGNTVSFDSRVFESDTKHFLGEKLYMDGEQFGWSLMPLGDDTYYIAKGTQYINIDKDNNLLLTDAPATWKFLEADAFEAARLEANMATLNGADNVDATFLIKQAGFNRNDQRNSDSWTVSSDCTNKNLGGGGSNGNGCAESYHSKFTISQKLVGIPNGIYELTAQGFYRQDDGKTEDAPVFFANDKTQQVLVKTGDEGNMGDAGVSFTDGKYTMNQPIEVTVIDGNLEVGIKGTATSQWVIFDNFKLKLVKTFEEKSSIAELAASAGKTVVFNMSGLEVLNKDDNGNIVAQNVTGDSPVGIVIKAAGNVSGASLAELGKCVNVLLLGSYDAAKHEFTVDGTAPNKITVAGDNSTVNAMTVGTAANKENTYLLVKVENVTIAEKGGAFYVTNDNNDEIKLDKRLDENIKVNDGDLAYEIVGVTFMDGDVCVLAPLSKDAIVDNKAEAADGDFYDQGENVADVEGTVMIFGGDDANGAQYEFVKVDQEVNNFATMTKGIGQVPADAEGQAFDKELMNLPTTGTYYKFVPTKDGQLNVTVGLEKGKTLIVTEDGEVIKEEKQAADLLGSVSFPVKATNTYYVFASDAELEYYGFTFTPANVNDNNIAKDIATFKQLKEAEAGKADKLMLNDAVVTYIKGDDVFVEDASGAIDFFETRIQFYVGQVLNGYIEGSNSTVDNMPVLKRVDGKTTYTTFQVTDKVTPEAKTIGTSDAAKEENLARFARLEYVELTADQLGLRVLSDPQTGESVRIEDRFNVFNELGDLLEKVEGIVGIDKEGTFVFWPTYKEAVVVSDGYKKAQETELDVTNKDEAKSKNNPVVGISITLDGACNAGSGSAKAGAMTSKGYKLRTANGSPDANSAKFTVNEGQKVYDMVINGVGNYKAKDETLPLIKVTKVEVDGNEVSFEGGEFPAKGAADCGTLTLKDINATQSIVLYFDNSNAEGTQINMAYAVNYRGEKVFTSKELSLIEQAKELAKDREAIAVGCLDDAIEAAEAGNTEDLQKAIDQFKADNATSSIDCTDKVGKDVNSWKNVQECPAGEFKVYTSASGVNLVQVFGVTGEGDVLNQEITGLENGTYNIGLYATSHNAWDGLYGENKAGKPTLQNDADNVAYVYGTSGNSTVKTWITARRNSALIAGEPELYKVNGVKVADGKLTIGLTLAQAAKTEWHSIQIESLRMVTTAKEAYAAEKANLQAAIDDAEELLAGDQIGGKAKLQTAVDAANEALVSIRLNVPGMANEVTKLKAAMEKFKASGKVFVLNVATGKYLGAGSSWGTHAVLNDTGIDYALTTNSDGTKNFDSQVSNGGVKNFLNGEWNDGEAFGWTVSQLSNGNYTISNGTQYLSAGDDNLVVLSDNADEWRFITVDERVESLATATSSTPVDATFLIKGANFNRNDKRNSSWTVSADCTNKNLSGGNNENNCAESYHSTFTISQVVEDVPAGTYTLTIQGFCRQDGGAAEDAPVFFANEETKAFGPLTGTENSMTDASVSFTSGLYTMEPITVVVAEDGTLTVGVKGTGSSQWVIWDNFQLMYYGNGGTPTAISETVAEPVRFEDGAIYNLRGQKMTGTLKPGLYIKNGKKIVIK